MPTAVLVDGGFFQKRYRAIYPGGKSHDAKQMAKNLFTMALKHIDQKAGEKLYRVFYYDCPPFEKKVLHPLTGKTVDFGKSPRAVFQRQFFEELKKLRKFALRLGEIRDRDGWTIIKPKTKELLAKKIDVSKLAPNEVVYDLVQKGVDMKIGLDIASLAYKRLADKVILISGDSDFVPAAKLARREGIDFVLDPMWNHINPDLHEHIDGLTSTCPAPKAAPAKPAAAAPSVPAGPATPAPRAP